MENRLKDSSVEELQKEVKELESSTLIAIEKLEEKLNGVESVNDDKLIDDWSARLDTIDVYTMEKPNSLADSIRQIKI